MTTSDPRSTAPRSRPTASDSGFLILCAVALLAVGLVWLVFLLAGEPETAAGALVGGGVAVVAAVGLRWRARRGAPSGGGSAGRTLAGTADERDKAIISGSLAWVGLAAFLANAAGLVAVSLGADGSVVLGSVQALLLAVLVASFLLLSRRL